MIKGCFLSLVFFKDNSFLLGLLLKYFDFFEWGNNIFISNKFFSFERSFLLFLLLEYFISLIKGKSISGLFLYYAEERISDGEIYKFWMFLDELLTWFI